MRWDTLSLSEALSHTEEMQNGSLQLELVDDCIIATMVEHGDLPVVISISSDQMLMEASLFPVSAIDDVNALNEEFLRSHKYLPLSTVAIETIHGEDHYVLFGALSASSTLENVMLELHTLATNVLNVADACEEHIQSSAA